MRFSITCDKRRAFRLSEPSPKSSAIMLDSFNKVLQKHRSFFVIENEIVKLNLEGKLRADYLASEYFI